MDPLQVQFPHQRYKPVSVRANNTSLLELNEDPVWAVQAVLANALNTASLEVVVTTSQRCMPSSKTIQQYDLAYTVT